MIYVASCFFTDKLFLSTLTELNFQTNLCNGGIIMDRYKTIT